MKKIFLLVLATITLAFASSAFADRDRGDRRGDRNHRPHPDAHWNDNSGWVLPAIIGGALVYGAINSQPQQQYYPVQPSQPQAAPAGYHWEQILDANCNCNRVVMVRN